MPCQLCLILPTRAASCFKVGCVHLGLPVQGLASLASTCSQQSNRLGVFPLPREQPAPSGFGGREGGRSCLGMAALHGPFLSSPEVRWGSVAMLLWLVLRGDSSGTPVGMAALTVPGGLSISDHLSWCLILVCYLTGPCLHLIPTAPSLWSPCQSCSGTTWGLRPPFAISSLLRDPLGLLQLPLAVHGCLRSPGAQQHLGGARDAARLQPRLPCPAMGWAPFPAVPAEGLLL